VSCTGKEQIPIFDPEYSPQILFSEGKLTEGPSVDPNGQLYFSDQPNDIIRRINRDGTLDTVLYPSGVTNGIAFDYEGRLLFCQANSQNYEQDTTAGKRSIVRMEQDGSLTVMAAGYNGNRFIAPNDLCVDKQGRIYFTDPWYPNPKMEKSQPHSGVYRIDAPGEVTLVISDLQKPNGILIAPDNKVLYVSDRGTQQLHRYHLHPEGSVVYDRVVYDFGDDRGIDGMCMDTQGYIYGAAGEEETSGVYVIDPEQGELLAYQPFPEMVFNVAFGGDDGKNLYVCSGGSVYMMRTIYQGIVLPVK
jgi:gluconolactonase